MNKSLQIFMIGWEYPPHNSGGLGVACQGITEALALQNHQLYFTLPYGLKQQPGHMSVLSCADPSWVTPTDRPPFLAYSTSSVSALETQAKKISAHDLAALPQSELEHKVTDYAEIVAKQASQQKNIDIIHAHDWMSFPAALKVKKMNGKPLVTHIHSTEYDRIPSGTGSPYIIETEQKGMLASDVVIAVSAYTKHILINKYGIPAAKIKVVHNGMFASASIDPGNHHFAPTRPIIVFMGRLTGQKGPEYFIELATQVLAQVPNALFVVAGNGDMYQNLLLNTAHQQLSAKVLFSGFVRDRQRETLLDRADVFIMPSISEPFGLVALEAAERHTPVIVSKQSGVREVLPSAIAIDFWDTQKMAETVIGLIQNVPQRDTVVREQLKHLQSVTWGSAAQKIDRVYRQALRGQPLLAKHSSEENH